MNFDVGIHVDPENQPDSWESLLRGNSIVLRREQMEAGGSEAASLMEAGDEDESESTVLI